MTTEPTPDRMRETLRKVRSAMQRAAEKYTRGAVWVSDEQAHSLIFELRQEGIDVAATPSEPDGAQGEGPSPTCPDCIVGADVCEAHPRRLAPVPPDSTDPLREAGVGADYQRGWHDGARFAAAHPALHSVSADSTSGLHSDGDVCTGLRCGNPEHGWAEFSASPAEETPR